ncbi:MAG: PAS domain S-box protein, partial [Methanoregula sp.]|nr:PAS domain S-box protein [Methanoregula sp.]
SQKLQRLMDDFTRLTGMGTAILDTKGKVLVATGWQEICTKFHRVNPGTAGFCTESDLQLAKNMKQGEYVAYKCRNHLWDVVTPLYIGSRHMGNIFTGQFFYDDDIIDESGFIRQADKYGFDRDAYLAALHRVPIFSREKIAELMDYLVKLTGFLSRISYSNINLARMGTERDTLLTSLQKSEDKFRTLVENIPQKIFTKDLDSRYVTINENFGHDLGIHPDEIVGKSDADLFPADLAARYRVNDLRVLKTGQTEEFEEGYLLDGKETWVRTIKTAIRDKEGEIVGLLGIFWDITDKKRAEDVLAESEAKFRTLFESMAPGVFYQRADGTFIDANPAALDMFGLTREQFMGRDSYDPRWNIVSETGELLPVEQHPSMLALRSGKMVKDLIVGVYNPARDDMRWLSTNAEPQFRTGETLPYQVFVTMYDITGRKRAEEVLAESEKRFRQVFDSLPIGMWIADRNGKLLMGNPAGQDIWEAHPQVGQEEYGVFKAWRLPSHEMVRPDEWALGYAVNEGRVTTQELLEIEAFNGSHKFILNWAAPVKNDAGEITGAFVLNQDITDSVMSERALQESKSFLNILLEAIPIPVFYKDREGRYLGFNKAFENFYAKSKEQLIGKSVFDISPPELAKVYHAADIKLFEKPGIQVYD